MTSHDLARKLLELPDLLVTVRGYEDEVDEIQHIEQVQIHPDEWSGFSYYGDHGLCWGKDRCDKKIHVTAIYLSAEGA
jgi:hypothetical protein